MPLRVTCMSCASSPACHVRHHLHVLCVITCRGMLPTEMSGMFWLRSQIREVVDSVWRAATDAVPPRGNPCQPRSSSSPNDNLTCHSSGLIAAAYSSADAAQGSAAAAALGEASRPFKPDLILANQLAYGQVGAYHMAGTATYA
jgi:hypothetical protein